MNDDQHELIRQSCAADPIAFINEWVWTFDPRNVGTDLPTDIPLDLFPRQEELITWLIERQANGDNGIVEKSRDMGLTWCVCAVYVHQWLFVDGWQGGIGSRKLQLVDNLNDMSAIFPKIRFIINHLPRWMLPAHFGTEHDLFCRLINPASNAAIIGEAGDEIGRGGRTSMYFADEFAFIEHQAKVNSALSQNTRCIIKGSTPNGTANDFYEERQSGRTPVFTMHWHDHPAKDQAWYDNQVEKYDAVTIAKEIDIDYKSSVQAVFNEAWWQWYEPEELQIETIRRHVHSWDTAFKDSATACDSAYLAAKTTASKIFLYDGMSEKLEYPDLKEKLVSKNNQHRPHEIFIEDKASGQSLIQEFSRETMMPIVAVDVDANKFSRANASTPLVKLKKVYLPRGDKWVAKFLKVMTGYSGKKTDPSDYVDAFSQLMQRINFYPSGAKVLTVSPLVGGPVVDPYASATPRREVNEFSNECFV